MDTQEVTCAYTKESVPTKLTSTENNLRTLETFFKTTTPSTTATFLPLSYHLPSVLRFSACPEMAAPDGYAPGINPDLVKEAMEVL